MKSPTKQDLKKLPHHSQIYFACFCAEQVFHLVKQEYQPACRQAIDIAKLFIEGKATKEECGAAHAAAHAAAYAAYAAYAAVNAAAAATDAADAYAAYAAEAAAAYAAYAVSSKDKQAVIEAQWEYYKELLTFETIVEDVLLG